MTQRAGVRGFLRLDAAGNQHGRDHLRWSRLASRKARRATISPRSSINRS